jgi:hypothetical protein
MSTHKIRDSTEVIFYAPSHSLHRPFFASKVIALVFLLGERKEVRSRTK